MKCYKEKRVKTMLQYKELGFANLSEYESYLKFWIKTFLEERDKGGKENETYSGRYEEVSEVIIRLEKHLNSLKKNV